MLLILRCFFFFKQKAAYEMRISDWSSDVCSSDLITMSAYSQADGELTIFGRPLRLQAGVRYTDVDTDVTFTDRYSLVTTRGSSGTWKFLPSATAIFDVTDRLR